METGMEGMGMETGMELYISSYTYVYAYVHTYASVQLSQEVYVTHIQINSLVYVNVLTFSTYTIHSFRYIYIHIHSVHSVTRFFPVTFVISVYKPESLTRVGYLYGTHIYTPPSSSAQT